MRVGAGTIGMRMKRRFFLRLQRLALATGVALAAATASAHAQGSEGKWWEAIPGFVHSDPRTASNDDTHRKPEAIDDLPTGGRRLVQRVEGYRFTVKSGQVTFDNGEFTGALPGTLVRGGRDAQIL